MAEVIERSLLILNHEFKSWLQVWIFVFVFELVPLFQTLHCTKLSLMAMKGKPILIYNEVGRKLCWKGIYIGRPCSNSFKSKEMVLTQDLYKSQARLEAFLIKEPSNLLCTFWVFCPKDCHVGMVWCLAYLCYLILHIHFSFSQRNDSLRSIFLQSKQITDLSSEKA